MPQGVASGGNFLAPGKPRMAGDPTPIFAGDTANPIRFPVAQTLYVRKTGSDNNGGSSVGTSPTATGSDGTTDGTAKFTAASGAFDASYVDRIINIVGVGRFRIEAVAGATELTLSAPAGIVGSAQTWNVGGAVQTIGALLGNGSNAVREGDTIYVGSGTYRERVVVPVAPKNGALSRVSVIGDVTGAFTGDTPGMVMMTCYLTNDTTLPSAAPPLWLSSGVSGFSFQNFFFVGGLSGIANCVFAGNAASARTHQATSQLISFTSCAFKGGAAGTSTSPLIMAMFLPGYPLHWAIDKCFAYSAAGQFVNLSGMAGVGGADFDLDVVITNTIGPFNPSSFVGTNSLFGSSTVIAKPGGVVVRNCFLIGDSSISNSPLGSTGASTVFPWIVRNCLLTGTVTAPSLGGPFAILEDYNVWDTQGSTTQNSVQSGGHSISDGSYAALFHFGQEFLWGSLLRQFGEPMAGSPLLGFGGDGSQTSYDLRGQPRPAGGGNALAAVGALERSNTFAKETVTVYTGSNAISATGPAYQDFLVPVASGSTYTISVYVNYDGSYTGTAPQIKLLNGTEAGVTDQTVTAGGSAGGGWVQVSLAAIAPTSSGFVTVRVQSNDTSGVSKTAFDSFAVA